MPSAAHKSRQRTRKGELEGAQKLAFGLWFHGRRPMMGMSRKPKDTKRVVRPMERRKKRPRIVIDVSEPGQIIIDQGTREDTIDAPPGTVIARPRTDERAASA